MDTEKWKSILVQRSMYHEIVEISKKEGRTISGQLRYIFDTWKDQEYEHESDDRGSSSGVNG
jgi:hypothetical protein